VLKKLTPFITLTLIAIFVFAGGLFTSKNIRSGDNKPSEAVTALNRLEHATGNWGWDSMIMTGEAAKPISFSLQLLVLKAFSPIFYLKFMYFISILLAGFFFYLFIRDFDFSQTASLFGATAWMLSNTVLTLVYPGHLGKLMALSWVPLSFLFLRRATLRNLWTNYIYSGFFLGLSFLGKGYQISLYFGAMLFFYWVYLMLKQRGEEKVLHYLKRSWKKILKHKLGLLTMGIILLLIAAVLFPGISDLRGQRKKETATYRKASTQKWQWATQWSVPPAEIIEFAIPGLFGWQSGHPTHPYLGKLGRGRELHNLKLHSDNMGITTMIFLAAALFLLWKNRNSEYRFWLWVMIISLALALGKYLYLPYYLFHKLPFMSILRNPNRFVKLFAFAGVVLATHGFQLLFFSQKEQFTKKIKSIIKAVKIIGISLFSLSILTLLFKEAVINIIRNTRATLGQIENVASRVPVAFLIGASITGAIWYILKETQNEKTSRKMISILSILVIALVAGELWYSARHFIEYWEGDIYTKDRFLSAFMNKKQPTRIFFLTDPRFGYQFKEKLLYYNINELEYRRLLIAKGRIKPLGDRMIKDLQTLLLSAIRTGLTNSAALEHNFRYLEILGTTHIVGMLNTTNKKLKPLYRFRIHRARYPLTIYKLTSTLPRLSMQYRYRVFPSAEAAADELASSNHSMKSGLCLDQPGLSEAGNPALPPPLKTSTVPAATITLREYKNNRITAEVYTPAAGLLYLQDLYHEFWKVSINGKRGKIIPANLYGRAVALPQGRHTVVFKFEAPGWPLNASLAGYTLTLLVFLGELGYRLKKRKSTKI